MKTLVNYDPNSNQCCKNVYWSWDDQQTWGKVVSYLLVSQGSLQMKIPALSRYISGTNLDTWMKKIPDPSKYSLITI